MKMECSEARLVELLQGELTPDETDEVLTHLDECPKCRERYRVMALLETEPDLPEDSSQSIWTSKIFLVAACILIVLAGTVLYQSLSGNQLNGRELASLATSEAHPYVPTEVRASKGAAPTDQAQAAFKYYLAGDYRAALQQFPLNSESPELNFYRGVSAYMVGQTDSALSDLSRASHSQIWEQPSLWYMANTYLKLGNRKKAVQLMQRLESSSNYGKVVEPLLEEIETAD